MERGWVCVYVSCNVWGTESEPIEWKIERPPFPTSRSFFSLSAHMYVCMCLQSRGYIYDNNVSRKGHETCMCIFIYSEFRDRLTITNIVEHKTKDDTMYIGMASGWLLRQWWWKRVDCVCVCSEQISGLKKKMKYEKSLLLRNNKK